MPLTSTARVATDRPDRYRKQLASHFSRGIEVREETDATVLVWGPGRTTTLTSTGDALIMVAQANDAAGLAQVQDVTGSHLIRFGQKDNLVVNWQR
jgi:uncharacterized protein